MFAYSDLQVLLDGTDISEDVESLKIVKEGLNRSDTATMVLNNDTPVGWGSPVVVKRNMGSGLEKIFDGSIIDFTKEDYGPSRFRLGMNAEESIFHKMKKKTWTGVIQDTRVAVDESDASYTYKDGIVNTILYETFGSDIDRSGVETIEVLITFSADGEKVFDSIRELADVAYADFNVDVDVFHFHQKTSRDIGTTLTDSDFSKTTRYTEDWPEPANSMFLIGGEDRSILTQNTPFDSWSTIPRGGTKTYQFHSTKDYIREIKPYLKDNTGPGELQVRVQADDGAGNPIDASESKHDLMSQTIDISDIESTPWVSSEFTKGKLGPSTDFHAIFGARGDDIDVGVDSSGNLLHKTYYPWHMITIHEDDDSGEKYGIIKDRIRMADITDRDLAIDLVESVVKHRAWPRIRIEGAMVGTPILDMKIGQRPTVNSSRWGINRRMRLARLEEEYDNSQLRINAEFVGRKK